MDPIYFLFAIAIAVASFGIGRWWQRRQEPLALEGRLLDDQLKLSKRIAALKVGQTPEQVAEIARQAKVRSDILALDQANQTP